MRTSLVSARLARSIVMSELVDWASDVLSTSNEKNAMRLPRGRREYIGGHQGDSDHDDASKEDRLIAIASRRVYAIAQETGLDASGIKIRL